MDGRDLVGGQVELAARVLGCAGRDEPHVEGGLASVTSDFEHVVGPFDRRTEVLDPLRQALHELEQLGCGGGRPIDPLARCVAADQPRLEAFELR